MTEEEFDKVKRNNYRRILEEMTEEELHTRIKEAIREIKEREVK